MRRPSLAYEHLLPFLKRQQSLLVLLGAELFTWASGRNISRKEAMRCARRDPGRSWEAIYSEMDKLGAHFVPLPTFTSLLQIESCRSRQALISAAEVGCPKTTTAETLQLLVAWAHAAQLQEHSQAFAALHD